MTTIQAHLDDCLNCTHQRIHHDDSSGKCLIGVMIGRQCICEGFEKKK